MVKNSILKSHQLVWLLVLLAAFVYRHSVPHDYIYLSDSDMPSYIIGAQAFLAGKYQYFPIYRTPAYSLFMLLVFVVSALVLHLPMTGAYQMIVELQSLMVLATGLLAADLYRRLFNKPFPAAFVLALVCFSPSYMLYERYLLSEVFYMFSFTLAMWLSFQCLQSNASARSSLVTGLGWATVALSRPIGMIPCLFFSVLLALKKTWKNGLSFIIPIILLLGLWVGFNVRWNQYWGIAAGLPLNQLYKLVDYIDYDSNILTAPKKKIYEHYVRYAPGDPARYLAVLQGFQAANHGDVSNRAWLEYNRQSAVMLGEIWRERPWVFWQNVWQEEKKMVWATDKNELPWPVFLFISLCGLIMLIRQRAMQRQFLIWTLIAVASQLLVYPLLIYWQIRFRYPVEPILSVFFVYAIFSILDKTLLTSLSKRFQR
jgi:hypothetical protein